MTRPPGLLLALDLGMSCGWALFSAAGVRIASGTWKLGASPGRSRFGHFLLLLRTRVAAGVRHVAYEAVHRHAGTDAAHVYGGWLAQLAELEALTGVSLVGLRTQDLHAAAGVSRVSKAVEPDKTKRRAEHKRRMVAAAVARGWPVKNDNEAEACFCGLAALTQGAP